MKKLIQTTLTAAFAAASLLPLQALAAEAGGAQAGAQVDAEQQAKIKSIAQEYKQVAGELAEIREATYAANPELAEQRDVFQQKVQKHMADQGVDPDASVASMKGIAKQLKSGEADEAQQKELMQKFQSQRQELAQARQQAMAEPEVKKAGKQLRQDTIAAMKAQNDKTGQLLDRLKSLSKELKQATSQS